MAYSVSIEGTEAFRRDTERLVRGLRSPRPLMERIGAFGASSTVARIAGGVAPDNAPLTRAWKKDSNTPLRDRGQFQQSITHRAGRDWAAWGSDAVQARILQVGGVIRPKNGKRLAVPWDWWTRRMMRRYGERPGQCIDAMKRSGDWKIWPSKSKKVLLCQPKTKGGKGKIRILFWTPESVTIPSRRYLQIDPSDQAEIGRMARDYFRDQLPGHDG